MKVLYINSGHWWPHNNLDYGIINGFLQLHCQIVAVDVSNTEEANFYDMLQNFNPDFVFTLLGVQLNTETVRKIKNFGYKIGVWIVDDPYDIDQSLKVAPYYDYIFNTEKNVIDIYKKVVNHDNVYYLPLGSNEVTFKINKDVRYKSDICIIGTGYKNRLELIDKISHELIKYNTKIIGILWDRLKSYSILKNNILLGVVSDEDAAKFYSNAKINLNIHRAYDDDTLRRLNSYKIKALSPNNRIFDISLAGGFQIVDYREDLGKFYEIDKELIVFNDEEDLIEKIEYYLNNENVRNEIAKKAYLRTVKEHLFAHRLAIVLEVIKNSK
ncbi:CgeB family protein [Thermoanaerobacter uzonensis]|uniref:CgeB family protein n=1 Tax=Thermoanaerobacter uzonensis TaxID=447593 RepID=UPI003D767ADC